MAVSGVLWCKSRCFFFLVWPVHWEETRIRQSFLNEHLIKQALHTEEVCLLYAMYNGEAGQPKNLGELQPGKAPRKFSKAFLTSKCIWLLPLIHSRSGEDSPPQTISDRSSELQEVTPVHGQSLKKVRVHCIHVQCSRNSKVGRPQPLAKQCWLWCEMSFPGLTQQNGNKTNPTRVASPTFTCILHSSW